MEQPNEITTVCNQCGGDGYTRVGILRRLVRCVGCGGTGKVAYRLSDRLMGELVKPMISDPLQIPKFDETNSLEWAKAFGDGPMLIEADKMAAWFALAIEAGRVVGRQQEQERTRSAKSGWE